jgi:ABC-type Fe3+-hydroxamate transport system substrate-binding protein
MRKVFCESLGKELELPDEIEKIVSLSPTATEVVNELGLADKLKAVSTYCVHPIDWRKKIPVIGAYQNIKENLLKEINPDIILTTTGYQREFALQLSEKYNVYTFALPPTVSAIIATAAELGIALGVPEKATELQKKYTQQLHSFTNNNNKKPTVYLEIDLGGPVSFGRYSYITDAFRWLGINHIFQDKNCEWLTPTTEELLAKPIDYIIYEPKMFSKKHRTIDELVEYFTARGLGNLPAVKNRKIIITPTSNDFIAHHGPSFITNVMPWLNETIKMTQQF